MNLGILGFTGGSALEYYISSLVNELGEKDGIDEILLFFPEHFDISEQMHESVTVANFSFPRSTAKTLASSLNPLVYCRISELVESRAVDVLHLVSEIKTPFPLFKLLQRKLPTVATVHEPEAYVPTLMRSYLLNPLQNFNTAKIVRFADVTIVHGNNSKDKLSRYGIQNEEIEIIPHGTFAPFFTRHESDIQSDQGNILFFGRIFPGKGIEYLVQAAGRLEEDFPDSSIIIAGKGDEELVKARNKGSNIELINRYIPEPEAAELFNRASVVVLPYTNGSQSGIISIAAGYKTPVVATDVGNLSEMIKDGETGIVVPPRDDAALADAIATLLSDDELRGTMGERARQFSESKFSWDSIADQLVDIYERVQ